MQQTNLPKGARVAFGVFVGTSAADAVPLAWAAVQVYDWNERFIQVRMRLFLPHEISL